MSRLSLKRWCLERKMRSLMIQIRSLLMEKVLEIKLRILKLIRSLTIQMKSSQELIKKHRGNLVISVLLTFRLSLQ